jgi:uncharacterized protein (DUF608 family)
MATQTPLRPPTSSVPAGAPGGGPAPLPAAHGWPALRRYGPDSLARIALPIGGIGTGTVSLGGRGDLRDWEIVNRPAKGFAPRPAFFALRAEAADGRVVARCLEGPLDAALYEGSSGATAPTHGLPRFRHCTFEAAYPFGQVLLSDPGVPLAVRLQAFNPLIPGDSDASGLPVAVLRVVLHNPSDEPVRASVCGVLQNFLGEDGSGGAPLANVNEFRRGRSVAGVFMRSDGVDPAAEQWGTLALSTPASEVPPDAITYRTAWARPKWGNALLDFWDDFSADGALQERAAEGVDAPVASLAVSTAVPAGGAAALTFLLTWHFPNRQSWTPGGVPQRNPGGGGRFDSGPPTIGNYYTTQYADAWDAAERTAAALPELERQTLQFVSSFLAADLPDVVKEAALFNVSTLRTQTCFRTPDGHFYGWEGVHDRHGSCYGNCTHVWNYEQATAFLFGDLARDMRRLEFLHATRDDGHMAFRLPLPLDLPAAIESGRHNVAAADGQMGCLLKLYRDWQLSGDDAFLRELWPRARKALEYCWVPGGWDADRDGVMEGCQHNTMDVEYFGPNPQMGAWYLGALRAAEEMARHLGERDFAATCRALFDRGRRSIDAHLFNGEYYEHHVWPPRDEARIAPGLRRPEMGATDLAEPELQLGPGCLVDQLVGQYLAHVCGLGYLLDEDHVRTTLRSILRHNLKTDFHDHFNPMRSYVVGDEPALLMAAYPRGGRPKQPFPYYAEVMTGFEYTAAVHLLYEGLVDEGLQVIAAIRSRYDGRKRNPFDEAECGHHYARAMASWGAVLALTGFHYSAVDHRLTFAPAPVGPNRTTWFWSNGAAWGTVTQARTGDAIEVGLDALSGTLTFRRLTLAGFGSVALDAAHTLLPGSPLTLAVAPDPRPMADS